MANIPLVTVEGSAAYPIGAMVPFADTVPFDFVQMGQRFLASGRVETDPAKYDPNIFKLSMLFHVGAQTNTGISSLPAGLASNATGSLSVLVTANGAVRSSTDKGVTWTPRTMPATFTIGTFCSFVNGAFFVGGAGGSLGRVFRSTDAVNWTEVTVSTLGASTATGIVWTGTSYIVWANANTVHRSTNLTSWTAPAFPGGVSCVSIAANGSNLLVAALAGGNSCSRSTDDGVTWTASSAIPSLTTCEAVAYGAGVFVAVGSAGGVSYSTDGTNWSGAAPFVVNEHWTGGYQFSRILYSQGRFLINNNNSTDHLFTSVDGMYWERLTSFSSAIGLIPAMCGTSGTSSTVMIAHQSGNTFTGLYNITRYAGAKYASGTANSMRYYVRLS